MQRIKDILFRKLSWRHIEFTVGKTILATTLTFIVGIIFDPDIAFFWGLFIFFLLFGWDSRYVGALAILALTACPILLALDYKVDAELAAVWAYYFLVMTVILQIIEFKRNPEIQGEPRKLHVTRIP